MYVIGVCGQSCSGKTKAVNSIRESLSTFATVISQDSYYFPGHAETNFDVPQSIDFDLMISHIKMLIAGIEVEAPIYDFTTHCRSSTTKKLLPAKVLLVEGILIFTQKELRDLMDLKVFISAYSELAFSRRLKRDVEERGRTISEVTERYFRDVLPSSKCFVEPSESWADIVLKNNIQDRFIGLKILIDHISTILP
jgi:uridine kinase